MSDVVIRPFREGEAVAVASWAYAAPYDFYDGDPEHPDGYLTIDSEGHGFYAMSELPSDEVVGFCCFGPEARVTGQDAEAGTVDIGGGVRPDLLSRRTATAVLPLIIDFARERFQPRQLRTAVASFNERATRLCLSAGFRVVRQFQGPGREFQELTRPAD